MCPDGQERDSYGSVRAEVRRRASRPQPVHVPDGWATYYVNTLHLRILEETIQYKIRAFSINKMNYINKCHSYITPVLNLSIPPKALRKTHNIITTYYQHNNT